MIWLWIILAAIYILSPIDAIPGMHGIGWIDDIIVLVLLYRYLAKLKRPATHRRPPSDQPHRESPQGQTDTATENRHPKTPYEVLGIPASATLEEIKEAYRELAGRYHPDKVTHLGEEFQRMANHRFQEIQEAYDKLTKIK